MLHGWGANAQDVAALASFLECPDYQFFFPNAPFLFPFAPEGRMWYNFPDDYAFLSNPAFRQQTDLMQSRELLIDWLTSLEASTGVPLSRTILAGFSQGGAMTLEIGLSLPLAALLVLSGYMHAPPDLPKTSTPFPPVLMVHGRQDMVVPLSAAHQTRDALLAMGVPVDYRELSMGHEIPPLVLSHMQSFIEEHPSSPDKR